MGIISDKQTLIKSKTIFEQLYTDYNRREYVSPDPLQFLYAYPSVKDREIIALIASSLAYGRVAQILRSVEKILKILGDRPAEYLAAAEKKELEKKCRGFVHRFTGEKEITGFLHAISRIIKQGGTLQELYLSGYRGNSFDAAEKFVTELTAMAETGEMFLLPRPSKGSACKRLALFLRWMVRDDNVDPGGWDKIPASSLLIPLDTHMYQICSQLGLCTKKSANRKAAEEITEKFRIISPTDPVKYDFALTRFGIRNDMNYEELFSKWK